MIGGSFAVVGTLFLLRASPDRGFASIAPLAIYAFALVTTFTASAAYNLFYDTRLRVILRRIDHSAIFLMIAGTYTPFTLLLGHGPVALWTICGVWMAAAAGVFLKLFDSDLFERVGVALYLALGWSSVIVLPNIAERLSIASLALLAIGGLSYTVGVIFHLSERMRFHNAIWHLFVLLGASCHFGSICLSLALR